MLVPADGDTLLDVIRDGYPAQATVTDDELTVDSWIYDIIGLGGAPDNPPCFVVTPQGQSLLVEYVSEEGIFPLQQLRYLDTGYQPVDVTAWQDLPANSPHVVLMRPAAPGTLQWELSVSATDNDGGEFGQPVTNSATYTLAVTNTLDVDRDRLVEEVDARSN